MKRRTAKKRESRLHKYAWKIIKRELGRHDWASSGRLIVHAERGTFKAPDGPVNIADGFDPTHVVHGYVTRTVDADPPEDGSVPAYAAFDERGMLVETNMPMVEGAAKENP